MIGGDAFIITKKDELTFSTKELIFVNIEKSDEERLVKVEVVLPTL